MSMPTALRVFLSYTPRELAAFYSQEALATLGRHAELVFNTGGEVLDGTALAAAARDCDVVIAHRSSAGLRSTFEASPRMLAFLRGAVDVSTIDIAAASEHGILVTHATAGFGQAVAELAAAMMFDLARGISRARAATARGEAPLVAKARELRGSCLAVVGYGVIGRAMAQLGRALGMEVLLVDPALGDACDGLPVLPLQAALARADFTVCLAPSVAATRGLFGAAAFAAMRPGSFFLNLSRGELVDEDALEAALDSGRLGGAGLDVGSAPDQQPAPRFVGRDDVVTMPHVGGMTHPARHHQAQDTVLQVLAIAQGRMPDHAVNPDAGLRLRRHFADVAAAAARPSSPVRPNPSAP